MAAINRFPTSKVAKVTPPCTTVTGVYSAWIANPPASCVTV